MGLGPVARIVVACMGASKAEGITGATQLDCTRCNIGHRVRKESQIVTATLHISEQHSAGKSLIAAPFSKPLPEAILTERNFSSGGRSRKPACRLAAGRPFCCPTFQGKGRGPVPTVPSLRCQFPSPEASTCQSNRRSKHFP